MSLCDLESQTIPCRNSFPLLEGTEDTTDATSRPRPDEPRRPTTDAWRPSGAITGFSPANTPHFVETFAEGHRKLAVSGVRSTPEYTGAHTGLVS